MADDVSKAIFEQDLAEVLSAPDRSRWEIEHGADLEVFVTACPSKAPNEKFQARFAWTVYPTEPPSFKFRDPATKRLDLITAWPEVHGYRPGVFDACVNWSAEGFVAHPEWKNDPNIRWTPTGNVLLKVILSGCASMEVAGRVTARFAAGDGVGRESRQ
jgi:hypothetical protein